MSRRLRAVAFGSAALVCAALAAAIASGYRSDVEGQYGPLRPVVVTQEPVQRRKPLKQGDAERLLAVRRVPERFVPPDALSDPAQAVGHVVRARIPAGSYLLGSQLAAPRQRRPRPPEAGPGRTPVELQVASGAATARLPGEKPARVDVVITTEPRAGVGLGRTYVAAEGVPLLDIRPAPGGEDPAGTGAASVATLALTRSQALRLIQAESYARQVRLIGR